MAAARRASLVTWAVRSHRNGALGLGLGLGLLVAITGPSYVAAAKAIAGGLATLGAQAQPIAREFSFLTGPVERLDTIGGYLSYKVFGSIALVVAIYAAVQGSQVIRGSETKGLVDLWLAAGRTRGQILGDRTLSFGAALAGVVTAVYVGTGLSGALSGDQLWLPAIGQCVAVYLVGAVAFGLALLASQLTRSARMAAALATVYLVAAYFVANVADSLGSLSPVRFLSPFFYYQQARTLVPGVGLGSIALAVLAAVALALALVAWRLFRIRDTGGVAVAAQRQGRLPDYGMRPSRVARRWLWLNWVWEQRVGVASWCVGIFTLTAIEAAIVPTALNLIRSDRGSLGQLVSVASLTEAQYVGFLLTFVVTVVAGFVVYEVGHWVGDASQHRTDAVLAQPVGLRHFVAARVSALAAMSIALATALILGATAGAAVGGYSLDSAGLMRAFLDTALFGSSVGCVGLLAVALWRSGVATAVISALLVGCFFLTTISALLGWPSWSNRPSVFDAFGNPYLGWPSIGSLVYLGVLGAVCAMGSYLAMQRGGRVAA
jgi:ABC-2 type transport system permease protein